MDDISPSEADGLRQALADMKVRLTVRDGELSRCRQQYLIVNSLWSSLQESRVWRLLALLGVLKSWFWPRGFDKHALIPWQELQQLGPAKWRACGSAPQFCVPCLLPAGWLRVQLRLKSAVAGRAELLADYGDGFHASECLARIACRNEVTFDQLLYLPKPARGLRFDPIDTPGEFTVDELRIVPLTLLQALWLKCHEAWQRWTATRLKENFVGRVSQPVSTSWKTRPTESANTPLVSLVVATAGRPTRCRTGEYHLARCLSSIRRLSTYANYELIVVHDGSLPEYLEAELSRIGAAGVICEEPFNRAKAWNQGAAQAAGTQLVFLHDDVEIQTFDWIETLLDYSTRPEYGAVGGSVRGPNEHASLYPSPPIPLPQGERGETDSYSLERKAASANGAHAPLSARGREAEVRGNDDSVLSATAACLMTRREVFEAVSGFTEELGFCYADLDYCLKVQALGKQVVVTPFAQVLQDTPRARQGMYAAELQAFQARWPDYAWDPTLNPNLSQVAYEHRP